MNSDIIYNFLLDNKETSYINDLKIIYTSFNFINSFISVDIFIREENIIKIHTISILKDDLIEWVIKNRQNKINSIL